ncbi:MAG: glycosyltransferase, partial [Burkholderiales bacterium]|nr:glycosyltransferase [Burkholderiales bacterium]
AVHIASLFEGAGEDVVTSVGMLFPASRTAVTLYDLIPYLEQETYLTNQMLSDHYLNKFDNLQRAGMILSISDFSRVEALENTDIPADHIVNISSAVDGQFAPTAIDEMSKLALLGKSGIDKPFLLFTGSFDSRKNHDRLVEAFAKIPLALRGKYQLVIIGKCTIDQVSRLGALGRDHGLGEQDLVFVGHVNDADLVAFYNLCALFVFPSLREGFGLPVLEAMSCGVPTIGSNRTSIPEVIGRTDALFDPEDVEDMAAKIAAVLGNKTFHAELALHGLDRAKHFSWALSAARALAFFESKVGALHTAGPATAQPQDSGATLSQGSAAYESFLAAVSTLNTDTLDAEFLASAAHAIAANELRASIDREVPTSDMRIGWVSDWKDGSETAVHSGAFVAALPMRPLIFASHSTRKPAEDAHVVRCWNREVPDNVSALQSALHDAAIDVVVIQYETGMFSLPALARLVAHQKSINRHVFVAFHSTAAIQSLASGADMLEIRHALKSCDGIFVHTMRDAKILESFKVRKNVNFLPSRLDQVVAVSGYMLQKMTFAIACAEG